MWIWESVDYILKEQAKLADHIVKYKLYDMYLEKQAEFSCRKQGMTWSNQGFKN